MGTYQIPDTTIKYGKKNLLEAYKSVPQPQIKNIYQDEFFSNSPPSVFVGSKLKYPNVNIGILAPPQHVEDAAVYDSHKTWVEQDFSIRNILQLRGQLINSRFQGNVHAARNTFSQHLKQKFLDITQEVGMASKSVDMEFYLKKKVKFSFDTDKVTKPVGMNAPLRLMRITENTKVQRKVDTVVSDTDLKAADALQYLYKHKFPDQALTQLLSVGLLGQKKNRRLVSTRWSITAVDDTLGKQLIKNIKDYPTINDYQLLYGNFLGNHYLVFLFPDVFSYELFEMYLPGSSWNPGKNITVATDHESYYGRTKYASNTAGGYYAARLPLLEYLAKIKRQASALILRFETPDYWAGLGVFVVREAMRKTTNTQTLCFPTQESMLLYGKQLIQEELNFNIDQLLGNSKHLAQLREQTKLHQFF